MKKNLSLLIFVAAALAFSCSKELIDPAKKDQTVTVEQTFTASQEGFIDNDTKATFDRGIKWQEGDEIAISDGTTQSIFVATSVDEAGKAKFSLKDGETPLATSGVTYKAWYPVDIAPDKDGVMTRPQLEKNTNGTTPSGKSVNYSPNNYIANPMYAESSDFTLSFKNLCGLLKITYSDSYSVAGTAKSGTPLYRQLFESYTEPLWGPYTIVDNTMVLSGTGTANGRTELRNANAKYIGYEGTDYVTTYYYAIPAGTYNTLAIVDVNNANKYQLNGLKAGKTLTVERNKVYALNITINDLRTDLSRELTTANCYVCAGAGNYMFRATRGNERDVISGIDHVDVVWRAQTYNSTGFWDATNKYYKIVHNPTYKNGYIQFYCNGSQANALIAAYDASGEILWSWHIWSVTKNSKEDMSLKEVTVFGVKMLDRNLGALRPDKEGSGNSNTSVLESGYLYQWGRKDPFPGRGQEGSTVALIKMLDKNDQSMGKMSTESTPRQLAPPKMDGPVTVAESIKNPEKFIAPSAGSTHWASDIADTWGGETKTIYDPCPYGYRVPQKSDFIANWTTANFTECVLNSATNRPSYHGFYYSDGTNKTFFPLTGQITWNGNGATGCYLGSNSAAGTEAYGRIWMRDSTHPIFQVRAKIDAGKEWADRVNDISYFENTSAYGMAVRCVKEQQ